MPYTALRPPETAWARHLDNVRKERQWSATALWEDIYRELVGPDGKALGLGRKSLSAFKPVLIDKPMPEDWAKALAPLYGEPQTKDEAAPSLTGTAPDLAAALTLLATELSALRQERQALAAEVRGLKNTVDQLVASALAPQGSAGRSAPSAQQG